MEGKVKERVNKVQADVKYSRKKGKRKAKNKPDGPTKMWLRRDKKCKVFFFFEGRGLKVTTQVLSLLQEGSGFQNG